MTVPQQRSGDDRLAQVRSRVRSAARWHGWMWLTIAVVTPAFLLGTNLGDDAPPSLSLWVALAFMVIGVALWVADARRPVRGRRAERVDRPATWAYVGATVIVVVASLVDDPTGLPAWYVVLALLPAVPALVAAAAILRS
ncbi:hypothetical protein FTX61_04920 [Nitriliruptoraceae bacterium ZYF776]|nr:hypothetical protein [Profundirhabdus halotolerans]